jgi:hypothetical protein
MNEPPKASSEVIFRMLYDEPETEFQNRFADWIEGAALYYEKR